MQVTGKEQIHIVGIGKEQIHTGGAGEKNYTHIPLANSKHKELTAQCFSL